MTYRMTQEVVEFFAEQAIRSGRKFEKVTPEELEKLKKQATGTLYFDEYGNLAIADGDNNG